MKVSTKFIILLLIFSSVLIAALAFVFTTDIAVLHPKGLVGTKEKELLLFATLLLLIVVIPVFLLTFGIAWKYRVENKRTKYDPEHDHNFFAECVWWGIPCVIMIILGIVTWKACHELDPFKPIESEKQSITIQVVALQWKWLFIYPEQRIATVNFVQFPVDTPVHFEITSDAPMNSFWIPRLGGQIYAMSGMRSKLYLMADTIDEFRGSSANISGTGFSGMAFTAKSSSQEDFDQWVSSVGGSSDLLTVNAYEQLSEPSEYHPVVFYRLEKTDLFDWIIMKYMANDRTERDSKIGFGCAGIPAF
jgi:cytochrome o ubiquinol oxidase subunit 2